MARRSYRCLDISQISVLAIVLMALALAGCRGKSVSPPPANTTAATNTPGEVVELTGIEIPFHNASGDIEGVIRAKSAEGDMKAEKGSLKNVTMRARQKGVDIVDARAGAAKVMNGTPEVRLVDGVVFELKKDRTSVQARAITWNWETGRYVGSGNVEVRTGDAVGRGSRIVGNTRTGEVSLGD